MISSPMLKKHRIRPTQVIELAAGMFVHAKCDPWGHTNVYIYGPGVEDSKIIDGDQTPIRVSWTRAKLEQSGPSPAGETVARR